MATKGIYLSVEVLRDHSLTMQEKLIMSEIEQLSNLEDKSCYAGNDHFAKMLDISKKSASNTISSLKAKGRIEVILSDRNHKRLLSIKDGQVSTKDGQTSTKDGESKDTITNNKTNTKKDNYKADRNEEKKTDKKLSDYEIFLNSIKEIAPIKSKVTKTKDGAKLFKELKDPQAVADAYILHQAEKGEFAVRITAFMLDEAYHTKKAQPKQEEEIWM